MPWNPNQNQNYNAGQPGNGSWQQNFGQQHTRGVQPSGYQPQQPGAQPRPGTGTAPGGSMRPTAQSTGQSAPGGSQRGRNSKSEVISGNCLQNVVPDPPQEICPVVLTGKNGNDQWSRVPLTQSVLSKHIMLLGGIGTGKTNAFFQIVDQLDYQIQSNDVVIIFDTKGDFYQEFYKPGDVVISNDTTAVDQLGRKNYWNIFNEVSSGSRQYESVLEISKSLFKEACENTNQIFFPNAARDIFMACMLHFFRKVPAKDRTNRNLVNYINKSTSKDLREMLMSYDDLRAMSSYISKDDSAQTQGVLSELQQVVRNIFVGNFARTGTLGVRSLVREKAGRKIFIEYDLSLGEMLTPIYSLMFDMAIKEALGRARSEGNVYFITDEFRLLPNLVHIDDAVNFGRSLGVKFMIGIQNVEQIYDNYGEQRARSIMSGFSTGMFFRVTDAASREYIKDMFGMNRKLEAYMPIVQSRGMVEEMREASVVEDWDITNLSTGQAIIGMPGAEPFLYRFDLYVPRKKRKPQG